MGWTRKQSALALLMVITGSLNTISTKWADVSSAPGSEGGSPKPFNHPFFQANCMFFGETLCFLAFFLTRVYARRQGTSTSVLEDASTEDRASRPCCGFNPFIFLLPAMCDMCATTLMYVGLTMTYASSFQMLRGSLIIFTGLLSVGFLGRQLKWFQWTGILFIMIGLAVVGVSDFLVAGQTNQDINGVITGDLLIVLAQIITATQMVVEEKFVNKNNVPPLLAVGWEGLFGLTVMSSLLIPFYYVNAGRFSTNPEHRLEDVPDAFAQMRNSQVIAAAIALNILSIAFFNFAGISVTKELSATTRTVLDSVRTLVVWAVSLAIGWQLFHYLQIFGYLALVFGMCVYNDVIFVPFLRAKGCVKDLDHRRPNGASESESLVDGMENPALERGTTNNA